MSNKIRSVLTRLGLREETDSKQEKPDPETEFTQVVEHLKAIGEGQENLNELWNLEGWLLALAWLEARRELADVIAEWFESPLFILRMAAIRVAGRWAADGFQVERWLPSLRRAVLDVQLGQWTSVTACRTVAELRDQESLPTLIEMLPRPASDWHAEELIRALDTILAEATDEDLSQRISAVPISTLKDAVERLRGLGPSTRPQLERLLDRMEDQRRTTVDRKLLQSYGRILNERPETGDRAHFVEPLLEAMENRLSRPGNRSFLLVGPSGVGKTAAIRELGRRLARASPPVLLLEASTVDVMAGTRWVGEWQTRLRDLVEAIQAPKPIVWYIPDIANIFSAGRSSTGYENFSDYLLPFVERGEIVIIGEAVPQVLRTQIESVPAARQALPIIRMNEPTPSTSREIVERVREEIRDRCQAQGRRLRLDDETLEALLAWADRYSAGIASPGRQVRLLREVASERLQEVEGDAEIQKQDVLSIVAARTGIPRKLVDDSEPLDLETVRAFFRRRVFGQDSAVEALVDRIALIKAGLLREDKPLGVFFFVGPTGVGKTESAKALAEFLFGSPDRLIRVDMSEFKDYSSFEKLIGNPRDLSYTPTLLARVRQQPFSVVLLDEFEKAHPNIFDLFLQVFDNGRLTDASGEASDFRQTTIIMTSNLGSHLHSSPPPGFAGEVESLSTGRIQREMERFFRPEFINRIDRIVTFEPFDYEVMQRLARAEIDALIRRSERFRRNMLLEIEPSAMALVLKQGFSPVYGARPLKRQVEHLLAAPLAHRLVEMKGDEEALFILSAPGDSVRVDAVSLSEKAAPDIPDTSLSVSVPIGQGERDLSLPDCRRLRDELETRYHELLETAAPTLEEMRKSREHQLSRTGESSFWEDNLEARRILALTRHQELTLGSVDELQRDFFHLGKRLSAGREISEAEAARLGARLGGLSLRLNQLEVALRCRGPLDHHDVFISAQPIGKQDFEEDLCGPLLKMYTGWLSSRDFEIRLVDQRWDEQGSCASWTLRAQGHTLFGWLRRETGLHRFVHGATSEARQRAAIVRVTVLPDPERDEFKAGEIRKDTRTPGLKPSGEPFATALSLVHLPTLTMVQGQCDEASTQCESLLRDWLHARVEAPSVRLDSPERRSIVRQYILSPSPLVKDAGAKLRTGRIQAVFAGQIEEFLIEHVRRCTAGDPG